MLEGGDLRLQAATSAAVSATSLAPARATGGALTIKGAAMAVTEGGAYLGASEVRIARSAISTLASGVADSGAIFVTGDQLRIRGGDGESRLLTESLNDGAGGDLRLEGDVVRICDTRLASAGRSAGDGGDITVEARHLRLTRSSMDAYNVGAPIPGYPTDGYSYGADLFLFGGGEGDVGSLNLTGDLIKVVDSRLRINAAGPGGGEVILRGGDITLDDAELTTANRNALTEERLYEAYANFNVYNSFGIANDYAFGSDGAVAPTSVTGGRRTLSGARIASTWYGKGPGDAIDISVTDLIANSPDGLKDPFSVYEPNNPISLRSDGPGADATIAASRIDLTQLGVLSEGLGDASGGDLVLSTDVFRMSGG